VTPTLTVPREALFRGGVSEALVSTAQSLSLDVPLTVPVRARLWKTISVARDPDGTSAVRVGCQREDGRT